MDDATVRQLDMLMLELGKAPGFNELMASIAEEQTAEQGRLMKAPTNGESLETVYYRIGKIRAYGEVLAAPNTLAQQAVAAREAEQQQRQAERIEPIVAGPRRRPRNTARSAT